MASTTTNIGLTKPAGTDQALISAINGNMDIIDTKMGAVGNTSVQSQITSLSDQMAKLQTPTTFESDFNDCKSSGLYKGNSGTSNTQNMPRNGYFVLNVMPYSANDVAQLAVEINSGDTYLRVLHDGTTWTSWRTILS